MYTLNKMGITFITQQITVDYLRCQTVIKRINSSLYTRTGKEFHYIQAGSLVGYLPHKKSIAASEASGSTVNKETNNNNDSLNSN